MKQFIHLIVLICLTSSVTFGQPIHSASDTTSRNFPAGWYRLGGIGGDGYLIPKTGPAIRFSLPKTGTSGQVLRRTGTLPNAYGWQSLGTLADQNANAVNITGGTANVSSLTVTQITFPDNSKLTTAPNGSTGTTGSGLTFAGKALIIYDGNSLWAGRGSSHEITSPDDFAPGPFPVTTQSVLTSKFPSATFTAKNFGVSGQQTTAMIGDAATQIDVLFNPTTYDRNIIICGEITNHMADGGATAQTAIDSYVSYCKSRRAAGFTVICTTVLPRTSNLPAISAAEFESRRTTVNAYIRANWPKFSDGIADIAALTGLTYPDETHTNDAGYVLIGNLVGTKATDLVEKGFNSTTLAVALGSGGITTTPPSSTTATGSSSGTVLLLAGQGANNSTVFTDSKGHPVTGSGAAKISTTQFKQGTSSIYLDGSSNTYISSPSSSDYDFGTGDFTLEVWLYRTGSGNGYAGIISRGDNQENQWTWCFPETGNKPAFYIRNVGGGNYTPIVTSTTDVPMNQWVHLAVTRQGTSFKIWQNGTQVGTTGTSSMSTESTTVGKQLLIGNFMGVSAGSDLLPGYFHVKITKGTALYNGTFTPSAF
jgi:hypothetical protein